MGIGFPKTLLLQEFGEIINDVFGQTPFHVGTSFTQKTGYRDVDVRLILSDEEYAAYNLGVPGREQENARWCGLCLAFSTLGEKMTGLPIDFQIQQRTWANIHEKNPRGALFKLSKMEK